MAKVITLARTFMNDHPRAGEPTCFVEKVLNTLHDHDIHMTFAHLIDLNEKKIKSGKLSKNQLWDFWYNLDFENVDQRKPHTIRNGHRFKQGDMVSLRVWSGKPYNSPQIIIAPDVEIKKVYPIQTWKGYSIFTVDGIDRHPLTIAEIAKNDGLTTDDFLSWFKFPSDFEGQVICWGEVNY